MRQYLFTFEEEHLPPAVMLAVGLLFAIFAAGIVYQLLAALVL
ncbi:hypothetical protein [Halostagnicola kamekurae]|uniref:Uncharacterized protein n=1 Tax=Halostagnicola kamekurae TaxID=619731 RepID=A0A1I6QRW2_9EURY|nr:hypothetical protein [Halostagnicola kamekurae]SFS55072.1 hypothetical protein SAMN04488556_1482 [Halostagnicola kamekurae]